MLRPRLRLVLLALVAFAFSSTLVAGFSSSRVQVRTGEQDAEGRPAFTLAIDPSEGFTMVIATYKRDVNLSPLLKHLTTTPPPSLRHIVLVWQNIGVPLPDFLSPTALDQYSTSGVVVSVRQSQKNSMNERFRPLVDWDKEIYTDAVMIMDDDIVLTKEALEWGYQEFARANEYGPGRIVGFTGRDFETGKQDGEWDYVVRPRRTYSMVLSNAAWLRKEWLQKYWEDSEEMRALRDYVDEVFNCDDILINYLVSNLTSNPPLLLQPKKILRTIGGDGLWSRGSVPVNDPSTHASPSTPLPPDPDVDADAGIPSASHFEQRKHCLAHYFSHFSRFAPAASSYKPAAAAARHFPLHKTSSSVSQDVEDHSRWLFTNEQWEEPDFSKLTFAQAPAGGATEGEDEEMTPEEQLEQAEFEKMLEGMTDDEIEELMKSLQDMVDEGEEEQAEGLPSDGEEGLEEQVEEPSVFEAEEQAVFGGTLVRHVEDEL
ncbi:hypothetical protein JCM10207_008373 [Rhodosporidiobolus poonsookiae]